MGLTYKKMKNVLRSKGDIIVIKFDYFNIVLEERRRMVLHQAKFVKNEIENGKKVILLPDNEVTIERI